MLYCFHEQSISSCHSYFIICFFVAEVFAGIPGKFVKIEDTIRSFAEILAGKHDDKPESAFYMKGSIDEVE